ncbi:hypothetical protein ACO229_15050 [Promicromonospora sp. MS192]|uniref:hypothetical protein n=1 Tax=Promicromonospora sp. MS192 TaxID=3412684 RepID=UPI003C2E40B1
MSGVEVGSPVAIVALTVLGAATLFAIYEAVRLWFDPRRIPVLVARMRNGIGRGDLLRSRAHVRALPVICVMGGLLVVDGVILNRAAGADLPQALGAFVFFSIPGNGILLALWAAIVWFNRPRFLVPPHMRADAGLRAARRAAERL